MPKIKDVSKCRRVPKVKQFLSTDESIDDAESEVDDQFAEQQRLRRESYEERMLKKSQNETKEGSSKKTSFLGSGNVSGGKKNVSKVSYPKPLPKIARDQIKSGGTITRVTTTKPDLQKTNNFRRANTSSKATGKAQSTPQAPSKRTNEKNKIDIPKNLESILPDIRTHVPPSGNKHSSGKKKNKPTKEERGEQYSLPSSDSDDNKKNVNDRIRTMLKLSREAGDCNDLTDVSLGKTDSSTYDGSLNIGEDPAMSSTLSGVDDSDFDMDQLPEDPIFL